jgi:formyltetrahydrofolate deformylase
MIRNIVKIDCTDEKGLVHKITGVFYHNGLNVITNQEYVEPESNRFFMRSEIEGELDESRIYQGLTGILPADAHIKVVHKTKKNIVVLVTKEHHCLGELLIKNHFDELDANIVAVIGNHNSLADLVVRFGLPFHHISAEGIERNVHEQMVIDEIEKYQPDYIVLAKYMRILTPLFVEKYPNKIINIHHSFLPAFIGANPYKQAYERGVKIIGATAHFVNNILDDGPIIVQDILHVDHSQSWQEMAQAGRNSEKIVLAKALKLVLNEHIFVTGNKTVIFE